MKRNVVVYIKSLQTNLSPVLAGLEMLRAQKQITLKYSFDRNLDFGIYKCIAWLIIDGKTKIFLDSDDRSEINIEEYNNCDFYLKRMILKEDLVKYPRLLPMGLNYVMDIRQLSFLKALLATRNAKVIISRLPHFFSGIASLLGRQHWASAVPTKLLYGSPQKHAQARIIFLSRLFNQDIFGPINYERIKIIKEMQLAFKDRFWGGLADNDWAKEYAPELILDNKYTNKKTYIDSLSKFDIGISNQGLYKSIGWKTAEYTMKSMGIISHDISEFYIPGHFEDEKNYSGYSTIDELLTKADYLLSNPDKLWEMKLNNQQYTVNYLKPDVYLSNVLLSMP